MMTIFIKDLVVLATHGFHPHEKETPQRFSISVELTANIDKAGQTDDLNDTLNWSLIRDEITAVVQTNTFNLIEKMAQAIADELLKEPLVQKVVVSIDKLDAFPSGVPGIRLEASN